jgi:hypothetical protein
MVLGASARGKRQYVRPLIGNSFRSIRRFNQAMAARTIPIIPVQAAPFF